MAKVINNEQIKKCVKATILIPYHLRNLVSNKKDISISVEALIPTVKDVIKVLCENYPSLAGALVKENGDLYAFLSLYIDDKNIRSLEELDTRLNGAETKITIRPSLAGG